MNFKYYKTKYYYTLRTFIKGFLLKNVSKRSNGEKEVAKYLNGAKIKYKEQVPLKLPHRRVFLDFQLEDGTVIEYNGRQHYEYTPYFHKSMDDFERQVKRDTELRNYCHDNGIRLLEIPYSVKNINKFLKEQL